ncbi:RICIN domain-containing protein [Streptomyces thioluteus]
MKSRVIGALFGAAFSGIAVLPSGTAAAAEDPYPYPIKAKNVQTGRCLDGDAKYNVYTHACGDDNPYQKWNTFMGSKGMMLQSIKTGLCMTVTPDTGESRVFSEKCDSGNRKQWWEKRYVKDSKYALINAQTRMALDSNDKGNAYTKVFDVNNPYQQWVIWY